MQERKELREHRENVLPRWQEREQQPIATLAELPALVTQVPAAVLAVQDITALVVIPAIPVPADPITLEAQILEIQILEVLHQQVVPLAQILQDTHVISLETHISGEGQALQVVQIVLVSL